MRLPLVGALPIGQAGGFVAGLWLSEFLTGAANKVPGFASLPGGYPVRRAVASLLGGMLLRKFGGPLRRFAMPLTVGGLAGAATDWLRGQQLAGNQVAQRAGLADYATGIGYGGANELLGYGPTTADYGVMGDAGVGDFYQLPYAG